jgi:CAP-Gly domain-containing linker protein 1
VRPKSRQSEIRSSSRMGSNDSFEVGDPVRIESLGYDGVLRYIGEIEGKDGTFAGVELGGGLVGKGKNDGSVGRSAPISSAPGSHPDIDIVSTTSLAPRNVECL